MDILGRKHQSLRTLVGDLTRRLPPNSFVLVDNWDDEYAIGLAHPSDHDHLVYITSQQNDHGNYFLSRELPRRHDLEPFHDAGSDDFKTVEEMAQAIAAHLGFNGPQEVQ